MRLKQIDTLASLHQGARGHACQMEWMLATVRDMRVLACDRSQPR